MEDTTWSWLRRVNIVTATVPLKLSYKFNIIPARHDPAGFITEIDKLILKFTCERKGPE
jgi:hypothetical protein